MNALGPSPPNRLHADPLSFDLHVRGEVPEAFGGSIVVAMSRRAKDRSAFRRWHDSSTDLLRLDLTPGRPGRICAHLLEVDPWSPQFSLDRSPFPELFEHVGFRREPPYPTQPNHGLNVANGTLWATNLLFGAPLEVDVASWKPTRALEVVEPNEDAPGVSTTSHFAWSFDRRRAYFHQSLLRPQAGAKPVAAVDLRLVELDVACGSMRTWPIVPPPDDDAMESANFHSAFYFEESGKRYVGLLRTGAIVPNITMHEAPHDHPVSPMSPSTIWSVEIDEEASALHAELLPGIRQLDGLALSHLDIDTSVRDGFVLYANFKEAPVGEETHGPNVFGEDPRQVIEHYSGMIVEALTFGAVIRYERRNGAGSMQTFRRPYCPGKTSLGHSWLPINLALEPGGDRLFGTFSGFRPRLLSRHLAAAYPQRSSGVTSITSVPSLLMRFDARSLEPDYDRDAGHLAYSEPVALTVAGDRDRSFVCTFSPELGLRMYRCDDLNRLVCQAESPLLRQWGDHYFRPEPAHADFIPR